jgi:sec-independent protein translocase protein TatA
MGFHWPELFLVGALALIVFGPKRLPEIGSAIGKGVRELKRSLGDEPDRGGDGAR